MYKIIPVLLKNNSSGNDQKCSTKRVISLPCYLGPYCLTYSLNNKGPCINGGNLTCKGDEVAPDIICECPPLYKGMFCEEKMETVIEIIFFCVFSILFHFLARLCYSYGQAQTQA